jgi:hypothetical protein
MEKIEIHEKVTAKIEPPHDKVFDHPSSRFTPLFHRLTEYFPGASSEHLFLYKPDSSGLKSSILLLHHCLSGMESKI